MGRLRHLGVPDFRDGTSYYWALADNVLATKEMARVPLNLKDFRELLNFRALFSKHALAPGICWMKNRNLRILVEKHNYGVLFKNEVLVPIFSSDCLGFTNVEAQDRSDSTAYRVKQDSEIIEFAQELDLLCSTVAPIDEHDFRGDLTLQFEQAFLSRPALRKLGLDSERNEIQRFLNTQSANLPNRTLRRSTFFFLGDKLLQKRLTSGYMVKTIASAKYHKCIADKFDIEPSLPDIFGTPTAGRSTRLITLTDEQMCFISMADFGRLSAHDIIQLRNSDPGKDYFLAASRQILENTQQNELILEAALQNYAAHIKDYIIDPSKHGKSVRSISVSNKFIQVGKMVLPFVMTTGHHLCELGLMFWYIVSGTESGVEYWSARHEQNSAHRERLEAIRKTSSWHAKHPFESPKLPKIMI